MKKQTKPKVIFKGLNYPRITKTVKIKINPNWTVIDTSDIANNIIEITFLK